jgi:hypothetical protein
MKLLSLLVTISILASCKNADKKAGTTANNVVFLRSDTLNVIRITDSVVIAESTCRGCEFEESTRFSLYDSLSLVTLENVITTDNNPPDVSGGNVSKALVVLPLKEGKSIARLYKFYGEENPARDSANARAFQIEVIK